MPTIDQLAADLAALTSRVNALDGQGLADPTLAVTTVLAAKINGVQTTVNQTTLLIQSLLQDIQKKIDKLEDLLQTHLGGQ